MPVQFDINETFALFSIVEKSTQHPTLGNIRQQALDRLRQIDIDAGKIPAEAPPQPALNAVDPQPEEPPHAS